MAFVVVQVFTRGSAASPGKRRDGRRQLLLVALCEYQVGPQWDSGSCLIYVILHVWYLRAKQSTILEDSRVPSQEIFCKSASV
jgi:hypothetical protein